MDIAERVLELLEKIREKIEEIGRLINAVLRTLPAVLSWIADRVRDNWNDMLAKIGEMWAWFADKLSYVGNPFTLNGAADGWKRAGSQVARINDTIFDANLSVDDRWTGRAAEQYKQSIEPQRRANTSIMSDYAENIGNALSGLAVAIAVFWGAVVAAIIGLLVALASAAVATGTIVGLPAAPVLVALGIAAFLAAAGAGVLVLYVSAGQAKTTIGSAGAGIQSWPSMASS
ncbi:hypothetical protein [Leifsonia aquatica]|uniref:hypothetical protein n=1 Tax=Leifsonia aquatica TaxID=144185 RepID=UPI00046AEF0A|nr:hypothetical protein [Leifsonia aquatica]